MNTFEHEQVRIVTGSRSGLPVMIGVHSTARGQAIGGCRIAHYPDWTAGLTDVLRLSAAMSAKAALAGLPHGGGKTVVALPDGTPPDPATRRAILLDVGDAIAGLAGAYATGPDVGTDPDDMIIVAERTPHVFCRPVAAGGSGDSSPATAIGTVAALRAVCAAVFGTGRLAGRRFAILGLGHVGARIARLLAAEGADLVVADVDAAKRAVADEIGARWLSPEDAFRAEVDVLVPAALGGLLTAATVPELRCAAVAGPANTQLDRPGTADVLHREKILWAPDVVVGAGGIVYATAVELRHETHAQATERVLGIGGRRARRRNHQLETRVTLVAGATRRGWRTACRIRGLRRGRAVRRSSTRAPQSS
jgi:glutamate dehydrogenase/leucine dehydrogenase